MLQASKSPILSFASRLGQRQNGNDAEAAPKNAPKEKQGGSLTDLMGQLDAGIEQSTKREAQVREMHKRMMAQAAEAKEKARLEEEAEIRARAKAQAEAKAQGKPVAQAQTAPAAGTVRGEIPETKPVTQVPRAAAAPSTPTIEPTSAPATEDSMNDALRIIAEQRKAAEALLQEANVLEERIRSEAQAMEAEREYVAACDKAQDALVAEQEAHDNAKASAQRHAASVTERKDLEDLIALKRTESDAATAFIAELEQKLSEAKEALDQMASAATAREARVKECTEKEAAAQREAAEAAACVAARQAEREAAENEAKALQERAEAAKGSLPAVQGFVAMDMVQNLAAKIAEQPLLTRISRNGQAA
jgi:chromosome segregation ATPase